MLLFISDFYDEGLLHAGSLNGK